MDILQVYMWSDANYEPDIIIENKQNNTFLLQEQSYLVLGQFFGVTTIDSRDHRNLPVIKLEIYKLEL